LSPARAWRPAVVARLARTLGAAISNMPHLHKISGFAEGSNSHKWARPAPCCNQYSTNRRANACHVGAGFQQRHARCHIGCIWSVAWPSCRGNFQQVCTAAAHNTTQCLCQSHRGQPSPAPGQITAAPNPSLKLSPNGGPRGPGRRYAVHFRQPGPRVPPSVPT
jgi:hypothetical protein